jgi:hypothetical protein
MDCGLRGQIAALSSSNAAAAHLVCPAVTALVHNELMAERLLTPSKITAWLDCAHFLTLRHEVDSGVREPAPNMFGEMPMTSEVQSNSCVELMASA